MKTCSKCQETKPLDDFYNHGVTIEFELEDTSDTEPELDTDTDTEED